MLQPKQKTMQEFSLLKWVISPKASKMWMSFLSILSCDPNVKENF